MAELVAPPAPGSFPAILPAEVRRSRNVGIEALEQPREVHLQRLPKREVGSFAHGRSCLYGTKRTTVREMPATATNRMAMDWTRYHNVETGSFSMRLHMTQVRGLPQAISGAGAVGRGREE